MSDRGTELMTRASRQLDDMAAFIGTLDEGDLRKPCLDEGSGDSPGDTVGTVAAHMAEGYHYLGRFLQAAGYVGGASSPRNGHRHGHGHVPQPAAVSDMVNRLIGGKVPIGLLEDLTDEQLDSVPPAGSSRFSDGRRTLEEVIDAVIAHQAAHLVTLKSAVA